MSKYPSRSEPPSRVVKQADVKIQALSPPRRRYHRTALLAVLGMLATVAPDLAALFAAIVALRGERYGANETSIDRALLANALGLDCGDDLVRHLYKTDHLFVDVVGFGCFDSGWCRQAYARAEARSSRPDDAKGASSLRPSTDEGLRSPTAVGEDERVDTVILSSTFVAFLDEPLPRAAASTFSPQLDRAGRAGIAIINAMAMRVSNDQARHLAWRRRPRLRREAADLAAVLSRHHAEIVRLDTSGSGLMAAILRIELHANADAPIVLVERDVLTLASARGADTSVDDETWDDPEVVKAPEDVTNFAISITAWIAKTRGLYVWSVMGPTPRPSSLPWLGACVGPFRFDADWAQAIITDHLGLGAVFEVGAEAAAIHRGVRALAGEIDDPRDAGAMAGTALAMVDAGLCSLDEACSQVAASFGRGHGGPAPQVPPFDERLLVCEPAALHLLHRARTASINGARILAFGPPGGGKSAYVRELAARMAGHGRVRHLGPADFLAKAWGATERRVRDLWARAADENEVLIIDEFEVIGTKRVHGDTSNNQQLVRSLTDAWLLALDEYPGVPLVVTTNDLSTIDPAIRRRFAFLIEIGDRLSADQERLAWRILLGRDPPTNWRPSGAAVADFVMAKERCRMLGLSDAEALQAAVAAAKAARGPTRTATEPSSLRPPTRH